jgi:hypothetical protein
LPRRPDQRRTRSALFPQVLALWQLSRKATLDVATLTSEIAMLRGVRPIA